MNMRTLRLLLAIPLILIGGASICQVGASFEPEASLASIENSAKKPVSAKPTASSATRFHKRFPQLFSGMAIEIAVSTYPMDKSNPVFRQFGNVLYEKLPEGGYSYLIMANFSTKEAALDFVQNVVKPKVGDAKLIQYNEGNRKVVRE